VQDGGNDPSCIDLLHRAIAAAKETTDLSNQAAQGGHGFPYDAYQRFIGSDVENKRLMTQFFLNCLPIHKAPTSNQPPVFYGSPGGGVTAGDQPSSGGLRARPNPPFLQGRVEQSDPTQPIRNILKGLADKSRAKGFPAQTVADTLSQEPDPLIAAAAPCLNLISDAVTNEDRAFALRMQALQSNTFAPQADQAFAASKRALDQFDACLDHNVATAPLAPMTLAGLAKKLAPHYDLSNPGDVGRVGVDIISGYLVGKGVGYVLPALPTALKAVFGKTGEPLPPVTRIPPPTPEWLSPTGSGAQTPWPPGALSSPRPPNVRVPDVLNNTPRPIYLQQQDRTCVPACIRMVVDTILRRQVPEEAVLRALPPGAYSPTVGTLMDGISAGLKNLGIPASLVNNASVDDIAAAVKTGYPAIVRVGDATLGHGVIVDGVVGSPGNRYFFIRDPLNLAHLDPGFRQTLQNAGFRNAPVLTEQAFVGMFETNAGPGRGLAVFTSP
jgi:hypothetical protein